MGREEVVKVVQEALARGQEGTAERNAQVSRAIEYGKPPWKKISFFLDIFQKVAVGEGVYGKSKLFEALFLCLHFVHFSRGRGEGAGV